MKPVYGVALILALAALALVYLDLGGKSAAWQKPIGKSRAGKDAAEADTSFPHAQSLVGTYGGLRIGMSKSEIAERLPSGISFDDLDGPLHYEDSVIDKYLITVPVKKLPILNTCRLLGKAAVSLQLAVVDEKLAAVSLAIPPSHVSTEQNGEIVQALKAYYSTNAGFLPAGSKPDPLAKEALFWAVEGADNCVVEAGVGDGSHSWEGYLIIRINCPGYFSYRDGKEGDAISPSPVEAEYNEGYSRSIRGFEGLRFGMSEEEALRSLPWGITESELSETHNAKDISIWFIYGTEVPAAKWKAVAPFLLDEHPVMEFMLGFMRDGLAVVSVSLPPCSNDGIIKTLKDYVRGSYGIGMYYVYDETDLTERWVIARHDGCAQIVSYEAAFRSDLCLLVGTNDGLDAFTRMYYGWDEYSGGKGQRT